MKTDVKGYLMWSAAKWNKEKWMKQSEMEWDEVKCSIGNGGERVFMEKGLLVPKWWEVKDCGESESELMIGKKTITINWTQCCLAWVILPSVHVVKL